MNFDQYLNLGTESMILAIYVAGPILILGLLAGLAVSIFQAATQINDAALAYLPKIGATILGLAFFGNFMMNKLAQFTIAVYSQIGNVHH
jgi:flagellar biosynthetic protein FliQ